MSLSPGSTLGPYEVLAKIGQGGMGEVYRARDTTLDRDVALKVLPDGFAQDPDRLARFEREAKVLASLNHPNIAAIYGLERSGDTLALVLELVEGSTLADRAPGPIALDEALPIARQIAAALEAAHEAGVIHRDLKPANVKVKDDGTVKVLDFGLAKALDTTPDGDPNLSPTVTVAATQMGVILGTASYMSPEQARGRSVDKRADVWAFGVVLFELVTGQRLFEGDTVSDTLAAVLRQDLPWDRLPASSTPRLRKLLERCLERDPWKRLRDIGDARLDLDDELASVEAPQAGAADAVPTTTVARARERVAWAVAAIFLLAAGAAWFARPVPASDGTPWRYFTQLTDQSGPEDTPAISPDGTAIAFGREVDGSWDVFVQRIGGSNPVVVAGNPDRDERWPAFSPDSQTIAFHEADVDGGLFIVGATGENLRRLTESGFHPAWSPDGRSIAYCTEEVSDPHTRSSFSELWVVDVETGDRRKIFDGDAVQPAWSPSGARIAFWSVPAGQRDIYTIAADGGEVTPVLEDADLDWGATWSPDGRHLYFASERGGTMSLWRIAIDEATGQAGGEPEPAITGVQAAPELPTFSADGRRMVFRSQQVTANPVAIDVDLRDFEVGEPRYLMQRTGQLFPNDVSPDGQWLALANQGERQEDIFISRIDGSDLRRLTNDQARDRGPRWSPDGRSLVFYSNRGGFYEAWQINRDGSGLTQLSTGSTSGFGLIYPFFHPAGDRLFGIHFETGRLFSVDAARGVAAEASELPPPDITGAGEGIRLRLTTGSSDGRLLAGSAMNSTGNSVGVGVYDLERV